MVVFFSHAFNTIDPAQKEKVLAPHYISRPFFFSLALNLKPTDDASLYSSCCSHLPTTYGPLLSTTYKYPHGFPKDFCT